ncbi:hypothetical protein IW140_000529 [Coemansia sp. RSA 1813]|nr:hypothetical protein EV178_004040 [Coemansia sp. RSA 1646]KAJ1773995.1 hypothetical protein LPJ74_000094 [Coemansia sp. RSA 1843]KAJ2092613.1 hypothetical protein IW138_001051 [Coemansia sp. RSA 986]KAJ2213371.1 hypothetical protein EV179_003880 [Coemansia sp. RSA 487]KAJ2572766.1 hypothetical protein IW140_000529 [Coemansia sp. RSA 1813]
MRPSPITSSIPYSGPVRQDSMHSETFGAARASTPGHSSSPLQPSVELASLYTRQFAAAKTGSPSAYPAMPSSQANTTNQSYTHGLTVLQCARSRGHVDPHVYRDWLIFEERLKQSYRRSQRKKRNYLVQIAAFGILVLYFAWFGCFGTKPYRFTCKLLSAGSAYCIYLIATNRRFLQSIKYTAQCNRALHQFRLRFETLPLRTSQQLLATATNANSNATDTITSARKSSSPLSEKSSRALQAKRAIAESKPLGFLAESHLTFFPTVPRQLRDGFMEFKATYYRKRDATKKRMQDRLRRTKQRNDSLSMSSQRTPERKPRQRIHRYSGSQTQSPDAMRDYGTNDRAGSTGIRRNHLSIEVDNAMDAAIASSAGAAALLASMDSATDDNSSTASTSAIMLGMTPTRMPTERAGSRLMYTLAEHDILSSESEAPDDSFT